MRRTETTAPPPVGPLRARRRDFWWISGVVLLLAVAGYGVVRYHMAYVPAGLDRSTTRLSAEGVYRVSYVSRLDPILVNWIHAWTLHIATPDGRPVERAAVSVDGKMPQHIHGLPTRPRVASELGHGDYQVEGLKFHMPGWWVVDFEIEAAGRRDVVRFNLVLD
jgi:hypothetical protein